MTQKKIRLKQGATPSGHYTSIKPTIFFTGEGKNFYLWIGADAWNNKSCYATLSGRKTLEKLAKEILKRLKK